MHVSLLCCAESDLGSQGPSGEPGSDGSIEFQPRHDIIRLPFESAPMWCVRVRVLSGVTCMYACSRVFVSPVEDTGFFQRKIG